MHHLRGNAIPAGPLSDFFYKIRRGEGDPGKGGATVLKVGGTILRAEQAKNIFDPPLFGQWGGQNIA